MRITKVTVDSFGAIKNSCTLEFEENLTLIYGPNESGKSTITEFIRSTLFPGKNGKYPQPAKTDSGIVTVIMDSGSERVLVREQKKVYEGTGKQTVADEFPNLDADSYRSLYCIDLDGLNDKRIITSDDFKNRFMTIPGGDMVQPVAKDIGDRLDSLMTKEKITDNRTVGRILKELKVQDQILSELYSRADRYDGLAEERTKLSEKVAEKRRTDRLRKDEEAKREILRSQSANLERLTKLNAERTDYEKYRGVDLSERNEYDFLTARIAELSSGISFDGKDDDELKLFIAEKDRIEKLWERRPGYVSDVAAAESLENEISSLKNDIRSVEELTGWKLDDAIKAGFGQSMMDVADREMHAEKNPKLRIGGIAAVAAGAVMIIAGAVVGMPALIPLAAVGAVSAGAGGYLIYRFNRPRSGPSKIWKAWVVSHGLPANMTPQEAYSLSSKMDKLMQMSERLSAAISEKEATDERITEYVNLAFAVFASLNIPVADLRNDVEAIYNRLKDAESLISRGNERAGELAEKKNKLNTIVERYGTEEDFLNACAGKKRLDELDSDIRMLTQSIESTTSMPISELNSVLDSDTADGGVEQDDIDAMNLRIGEITKEMEDIMKDDEIDTVLLRKDAAQHELGEALREWAVYSIAGGIVERICDRFYHDLEPELLRSANEYLSTMTDGRYQLDSDPRDRDITVRDDRSKKTYGQWSSGLGDQIFLSLKMAMAKTIGTESMPMILDDVFVRFDADRKMNACKALYEFSRTNQVILFTCDNTIRNYLSLCGRFTEIKL